MVFLLDLLCPLGSHQQPCPPQLAHLALPTLPASCPTCSATLHSRPAPVQRVRTPAMATVLTHHVGPATSVLQVCAPSQTQTRQTLMQQQLLMHGQHSAPAHCSAHQPAVNLSRNASQQGWQCGQACWHDLPAAAGLCSSTLRLQAATFSCRQHTSCPGPVHGWRHSGWGPSAGSAVHCHLHTCCWALLGCHPLQQQAGHGLQQADHDRPEHVQCWC